MTNDNLLTSKRQHTPAQRSKSGEIFVSLRNTVKVGGWRVRKKDKKQSSRRVDSAYNSVPAYLSPSISQEPRTLRKDICLSLLLCLAIPPVPQR